MQLNSPSSAIHPDDSGKSVPEYLLKVTIPLALAKVFLLTRVEGFILKFVILLLIIFMMGD